MKGSLSRGDRGKEALTSRSNTQCCAINLMRFASTNTKMNLEMFSNPGSHFSAGEAPGVRVSLSLVCFVLIRKWIDDSYHVKHHAFNLKELCPYVSMCVFIQYVAAE